MTCATVRTGAVTLIQRFVSALNLSIHFHMLFLDGVHVTTGDGLRFRRVPPPTGEALEKLVRGISERVAAHARTPGAASTRPGEQLSDGAGFDDLLGHSITYRDALGPHQGRKAFILRTVPAATDAIDGKLARTAATSIAGPKGTRLTALPLSHAWTRGWLDPGSQSRVLGVNADRITGKSK